MNLNLSRAQKHVRFEVELTKLNWRFFNCKILLCCICCCHLSVISLTFWQSLVSHIPKGIGGSPYLEGTSVGKYSFLPFFFFHFLLRDEEKERHYIVLFYFLSFARGTELAIIFPPGRRRYMHVWYTCIHSIIMQTSPGHIPLIAWMFITIIWNSRDCVMGHRQTGPLLIKQTKLFLH